MVTGDSKRGKNREAPIRGIECNGKKYEVDNFLLENSWKPPTVDLQPIGAEENKAAATDI